MIWTTPRGVEMLLGCALALALPVAPARADQPAVPAGRQVDPPGPDAPAEEPQAMDPDGRRAVRGCDPDGECAGDLLQGLHAFEIEAFPRRRGDSPWSDRDGGSIVSRAPGAVSGARRPQKPTELRPDLPWLAQLEMPDLPVQWDHRIIKFLEFYKEDPRGQRLMRVWLREQGRYKDLILRELRRAKLPEDLLYVCMIESGYDSRERSRVGATGLWQFMPAAGVVYGLRQNRWVDERNDPVRATRAVTAYFADLYHRFGDWDLAMAAYNAGYGAVLRGIARYNTNDFWRLLDHESALPWESSIYVPKALAAAIVGRNRQLFGFADVVPAAPLSYDEVTVPTSVGLAVIAKAAGVDTRAVEELNPHLRQKRTPPGFKSFAVRIPRGRRDQFAVRFPQLRGEWDTHDAYLVRHGERFEDVATTHGLTVKKLRELNGMEGDREVEGGTVLVVPRLSEAEKQANRARAEESLYAAGEPEGKPGDKLLVAVPDPDFKVAGKQRLFYRVVAGDSLTRIARVFGVDRGALATWNGLDPEAKLQARMVLQIWVEKGFKPADRALALLDPDRVQLVETGSVDHIQVAEKKLGRERITYTARKRESYEQIGKKYGLSARDVARINRKPYDTVLAPGETCVIYQVVDRNASERAAKQARQARPDRTAKKRPRK
ncbi:MAG TPA: transglycosylase SLT domain-containing protein [Kofleriaceae bacterium]|nr:transglycosylase SLT domain-containing protein [Kofleriaceae bacterium]